MEKLKRKCSSLQNYFVVIVLITFFIVICLSLLNIWGCQKFREYLLPNSNTIWVTLNITYSDGRTEELEFSTELGQEMYDIPRLTGAEGGLINNSELSDMYPTGTILTNNSITGDGIIIGDYTAGSNALIRFQADVVDEDFTCGKFILHNWGRATVGQTVIQDSADIIVQLPDCPDSVVEPEKLVTTDDRS